MEISKTYNYKKIEGWFGHKELYDLFFKNLNYGEKIVEVSGKIKPISYLGYKIKLAKKPCEIFCVKARENKLYQETNKSGLTDLVYLLKIDNIAGANYFKSNSVFSVFIYDCYDYKSTKETIEAWKSKIQKNGYLAGSNYLIPSVQKAVYELFPHHKITKESYPAWFIQV
jgi:hypothetical protein